MNMLLLGLLVAIDVVDIRVLTLLAFMQGMLDGAHMPVRMSIVPNLVSREQLQSAIAIASITFNVSRFVGPALAGLIIALHGVASAFVANGLSYLALIAAMLVVRLNPAAEKPAQGRHVWREMGEGINYVLGNAQIRALLLIIAVASVFGRGVLEMLPVFADGVFARGSAGLATLTAAIGAGAVASGLVMSRGVEWLNVRIIRGAVIIAGLLVMLLGSVTQFWAATLVVGLLGVILSVCGVGSQILIQTLVDDAVRGRVSSFWGMIAFGGTATGSLLVGAAANTWGLQHVALGAGLACVVAALWSALRTV
jgi:predicted MFS family arabinose efflux permease